MINLNTFEEKEKITNQLEKLIIDKIDLEFYKLNKLVVGSWRGYKQYKLIEIKKHLINDFSYHQLQKIYKSTFDNKFIFLKEEKILFISVDFAGILERKHELKVRLEGSNKYGNKET